MKIIQKIITGIEIKEIMSSEQVKHKLKAMTMIKILP